MSLNPFSNLFSWLRGRARDAVLAGCGDAVSAIDNGASDAEAAQSLQQRLQARPVRPAPLVVEDETPRRKKM